MGKCEYLVEVETPKGDYAWPYGQSFQEVFSYLKSWNFNPRTDKATVRFNKPFDNTEDQLWYYGKI